MLLIVFAAVFALSSCVTTETFDAALPTVAIIKASASDIARYGSTYEVNPYLEPKTLLRGKLNEFFVVKVTLNLQVSSRISIIADAVGPNGSDAAKANDRVSFTEFWNFFSGGDADTPAARKRLNTIDLTCVPALSFTQKAGLTTYLIPFVGSNPIPRPAKMYVQVSTGSGEPVVYTATLE